MRYLFQVILALSLVVTGVQAVCPLCEAVKEYYSEVHEKVPLSQEFLDAEADLHAQAYTYQDENKTCEEYNEQIKQKLAKLTDVVKVHEEQINNVRRDLPEKNMFKNAPVDWIICVKPWFDISTARSHTKNADSQTSTENDEKTPEEKKLEALFQACFTAFKNNKQIQLQNNKDSL